MWFLFLSIFFFFVSFFGSALELNNVLISLQNPFILVWVFLLLLLLLNFFLKETLILIGFCVCHIFVMPWTIEMFAYLCFFMILNILFTLTSLYLFSYRCYSALGNIAKARYLKETLRIAEEVAKQTVWNCLFILFYLKSSLAYWRCCTLIILLTNALNPIWRWNSTKIFCTGFLLIWHAIMHHIVQKMIMI